jgi:hypothetical protein
MRELLKDALLRAEGRAAADVAARRDREGFVRRSVSAPSRDNARMSGKSYKVACTNGSNAIGVQVGERG